MDSPLMLPSKGEELVSGQQYFLTTEVREMLREVYGLRNLPKVVECLRPRVAATVMLCRRINLETKQVTRTRLELPAQSACFHVQGTKIKFEVDLARFPVVRMKSIIPVEKKEKELKEKKQRKLVDLSILD